MFLSRVPLWPLQRLLSRIVRKIAQRCPNLFSRLDTHTHKKFLIDPVNLPLCFVLQPDPQNPRLYAVMRPRDPQAWRSLYEARIAASFLTLFAMVDGTQDGDALFFSRDLTIEGDTEAVVCLRNALDDLDESVMEEIAQLFGWPAKKTLQGLRYMSNRIHGDSSAYHPHYG